MVRSSHVLTPERCSPTVRRGGMEEQEACSMPWRMGRKDRLKEAAEE